MGSAQLFPGPGQGQPGWGLTTRIKDFSTTVRLFPVPSASNLLAPCPCCMRRWGFWAPGGGSGSPCAQNTEEIPTWSAEATDLGNPAAEHRSLESSTWSLTLGGPDQTLSHLLRRHFIPLKEGR